VGLGYVGLPLAIVFSEKYEVWGYEADAEKRLLLRRGISYIDDVSNQSLKARLRGKLHIASSTSMFRRCDCIIICVPTPLDQSGNPDLSYIASSARIVKRIVRKGMLVVLESTSYPGTTEEFLGRAIADAGFSPGKDVALAFSPERVDPGNKEFGISSTPKVVGGINEESTELAAQLYSSIVEAGVVRVRDCATAEAVKILENIFRGVNIALINEIALIFDRMGLNTWEIVKAAATKPFGFMAHYPGPGVGGHCIPLDPFYLSYKAKQYGIVPRFIELGREVNEYMKCHTVNLTVSALRGANLDPQSATVAVIGLSYKKNTSDTRESPAVSIIEELSKRVGKVVVHDQRVASLATLRGTYRSIPWNRVLEVADCLVFLVDHDEFLHLEPKELHGNHVRAIVDARNLLDKEKVLNEGLVYRAIGKNSCA
jgi:UDP-N-acetyl-D-glucosamine dehydrogenase